MKNVRVAFLLLAAVIVGVGVYRGWFTVNKIKIQQDEVAVKAEMHNLGQQVKDRTSDRKSSVEDQK